MLIAHNGNKKLNEGDYVMAIQANKDGDKGLFINLDWAFPKENTPQEIKSILGAFLANIENVFGEKMVSEAFSHYAMMTGKLKVDENGKNFVELKSKGLDFKK